MSASASALDLAAFTESISSRIDGFFYRCRNDRDYTMIWVSHGFDAMTGCEAVDFVENRRSYGDLIHPDDLAKVDAAVAEALAANRRWQILYRIKCRKQGWRFVHETGGGCARDPETGEIRFLDGVILEADRVTELAGKLDSGRTALSSIDGSIDAISAALRTLRLLSINARIEAAHAREHGAGFSVVAQEIMSLADAGESAMRAMDAELARLREAIRL